jgi:hypothetical protein
VGSVLAALLARPCQIGRAAHLSHPSLASMADCFSSLLYLRGFQTRGGVALASPFGTADDNAVRGHQLTFCMGRISTCRACRTMNSPLLDGGGLQREPGAVDDSMPVSARCQLGICQGVDPAWVWRLQRPGNVLHSDLMKQAVRCAAILEMWALPVAPAPAVSIEALSSPCGLGSRGSSIRLPRPSGRSSILTRAFRLLFGISAVSVHPRPRRPISCADADVGTSCGHVTRNPCQPLPTARPAVKLCQLFRGVLADECLCSPRACLLTSREAFALPTAP